MDPLKPGVQTSEWWTTLITSGVALIAMLFGWSTQTSGVVSDFLVKLLPTLIALWFQGGVALKYIEGRNLLKQQVFDLAAPVEEDPEE